MARRARAAGFSAIQDTTCSSGMPRCRASVQISDRPSCSDETPPQATAKSPFSRSLRSRVLGEWSETMQSMVPSCQPLPQQFPVGGLADRRAALVGGGAVGDFLGHEGQVVRAGLHGEADAVALGAGDHGQGVRGRQVQDVGAGAGPAGPFDHLGDGLVLGAARAGGEERRVLVAARVRARGRSRGSPRHGRS